jgi:hypothetical protein
MNSIPLAARASKPDSSPIPPSRSAGSRAWPTGLAGYNVACLPVASSAGGGWASAVGMLM